MKSLEQIVWPKPGRYVVAVSGGVDSMALLDLLATSKRQADWQLEVAHFNHGWTAAANRYAEVVEAAAKRHGLPFHSGMAKVTVNEAAAREVRYRWLRQVARESGAEAIITAHHADDLVETVVLNLTRGTGRRGLTPFTSTKDVMRPLTTITKTALIAYAKERQLPWVEDATNIDTRFRRNAVRHERLPQLRQENPELDRELGQIIAEATALNAGIDRALAELITSGEGRASASVAELRRLPLPTLAEVVVMMVQAGRPGSELNRRTVEALATDIKAGRLRGARRLTNGLFASSARDTVTIAFTP